jgi:hypothetical protein
MQSLKKKAQKERFRMGLTKIDLKLKHTPAVSEVLLKNGLGKMSVVKTIAVVEPSATTEKN